jgi:hypothetical protein
MKKKNSCLPIIVATQIMLSCPGFSQSISEAEQNECHMEENGTDPITWKKVLLYAGVCIVGVLTFTLSTTQNNK